MAANAYNLKIGNEDNVKIDHYHAACKGQEITFTFGIGAMG